MDEKTFTLPQILELNRISLKRLAGPGGKTNCGIGSWMALAVLRRALIEGDGLTMGVLAKKLGMSPAGASAKMDAMIERGLVHRWQSPGDRRKVSVGLTEKGILLVHGLELDASIAGK